MSYRNAIDLLKVALHASSRRGISLLEIADLLNRGDRTALRVVKALEELDPNVEKIRDDESGTYRWRLPWTSMAALLTPTADELATLKVAEEVLEREAGGDHVENLRSLHRKIIALIPTDRSRRLETDEEILLLAVGLATRPGPRPVGRDGVDGAISTAIKGASQLRIRYGSRTDQVSRDRVVAPYGLLLGTRRYLVARDLGKDDGTMRHYRIDAIEEAEVLPLCFERDKCFDLDEHAQRCFGSFSQSDEVHDVAWRFAPGEAARRAEGFSFHPTQAKEAEPDGALLVRFKAGGLLEMCWHLYQWGDQVEVLSPPELVEMVAFHRRSDFEAMP